MEVTAARSSSLSHRFYGILILSGLLIALQAFLVTDFIVKAVQEEAGIEDLVLNLFLLALTLLARGVVRWIGEQYSNPPDRWFLRKVPLRILLISKISALSGFAIAIIFLGAGIVDNTLSFSIALFSLLLLWETITTTDAWTKYDSQVGANTEQVSNEVSEAASESEESSISDDTEGLKSLGRIKELRWTDCEVLFAEDRSVTFRWGIATTGKLTIVTGPASSGKSTLFNSLMRNTSLHEGRIFVETSKGTFRLDELDLDYWLEQISWIPETPYFISGTIESNLRLIKPRANRERFTEILRSVQLDPESLPNGLQTSTDIDDQALTEQQRRKLAVARAILKDSSIFLVDSPKDPDPAFELELNQILKALSREGKLVILITGEPESLSLADRRINFDADRLTPTRLLEAAQ